MSSLLFVFVVSFLVSVVMTPFVRDVSRRHGILDWPDSHRKSHERPIPRVGGIAVALGYSLAFAVLLGSHLIFGSHVFKGGAIILTALPQIWRLFPAAALIFIIGLLDDLIHLEVWCKLGGQIAAATVAYFANIRVIGVAGAEFGHWWSFLATILWLVACCNAINLIDGMDGLAAGISLVASTSMLLAAAIQHNVVLALATVPLVGCLLGFFRYNFSPASIFLGDCGSLFIGFLLGCYGVLWSQKSATILGMTAPLIALSIPLADATLSVLRRFLRKKPIFGADRGHIHHRLLEHGLTPRRVALILYGVGALAAVFSLAMANNQIEIPLIIVFGVAAWFGIQRLRFVEFDTAGRLFIQGSFRNLLNSEILLQSFETTLSRTNNPQECWKVLKSAYREFGFFEIKMELAGEEYFDKDSRVQDQFLWRVEIPLSDGSYVLFASEFGPDLRHHVAASLVNVVHKVLETKLADFCALTALPTEAKAILFRAASGSN